MTQEEKDLIMRLVLNSMNQNDINFTGKDGLSKEEFFRIYPVDLRNDPAYLLKVLEDTYKKKDGDTLEYALMLTGYIDIPLKVYAPIWRKLLREKWHELHEMILDDLISLYDEENISSIYETAMDSFDYSVDEDNETMAIKAVWGLSKIGTPEAIEKVKLIAKTHNTYVSEEAEKALKHMKNAPFEK